MCQFYIFDMHRDNVFKNCLTKFVYQLLFKYCSTDNFVFWDPQKRIRKCHTFDIYFIILAIWSCKGPMIETCSHYKNVSCVRLKIVLYIWRREGWGTENKYVFKRWLLISTKNSSRRVWHCDITTNSSLGYVTLS